MGYLNGEGLGRVWNNLKTILATKQDTLSGTKGQVLGFDEQGHPVAQEPDITANEATQLRADVDFLFALQVSNDTIVANVFAMAEKYYPAYWDKQRIQGLQFAGKLTAEQATEILGAE